MLLENCNLKNNKQVDGRLLAERSPNFIAVHIKKIIFFFFPVKPRWVSIHVISTLLSSGRPQQYQCDTWGSIPAAKITWLLEGEPIRNAGVSVMTSVIIIIYIY